jgi:hypothetical protein
VRVAVLAFAFALLGTPQVFAQAPPVCHVLCTPTLKVEPTVTFNNLFGSPRIVGEQGTTTRERRETEFEVIVSVGCPRVRRGSSSQSKRSFFRSIVKARPRVREQLYLAAGSAHARVGQLPLRHRRQVESRRAADRSSRVHAQAGFRAGYQRLSVQLASRRSLAAGC